MFLFIDGYNVMKAVFSGKGDAFFREKRIFIGAIGKYFSYKRSTIEGVFLCFDGGELTHKTREVKEGIVILHSGQKSSADDLIVELIKKYKQAEILLVTNDRALMQRAQQEGKYVVQAESEPFWDLVLQTRAEIQGKKNKLSTEGNIQKIDQGDSFLFEAYQKKDEDLDLLMMKEGLKASHKDEKSDADNELKKKQKRGTLASVIKKI